MAGSEKINLTVHIDEIGEQKPGEPWAEISKWRITGNRVTNGAIDLSGVRSTVDLNFNVINNVRHVSLDFPDDPQDCIWFGEGTECPRAPSNAHRQLKVRARDKGDKLKLRVHNLNTVAGRFTYMLRFKRADGADDRYVVLDPPVVNSGGGGGGGGIDSPDFAPFRNGAVIGAVVVAAVTGAVMIARKRGMLPGRGALPGRRRF